jgi:glycosyltransferase involved in cell wall biosynthesis
MVQTGKKLPIRHMKSPTISCIVPVHNGERFLSEALDSILGQTYQKIEVIVVDDGSTDGTESVTRRYGAKIRYHYQANAGAPAARDQGVRMSNGELVAFLDADDLWHSEKLERQLARFQVRPELDLCFTHVKHFWVSEMQEEEQRFENHRLSQTLPAYLTQALLARQDLFQTVGAFNTGLKFADAMDWFLRAVHQGAVMELLPDALLYRRMHQENGSMESDTRQMTTKMQDALLKVIRDSLIRRRSQDGMIPQVYQFPNSDWNKTKIASCERT